MNKDDFNKHIDNFDFTEKIHGRDEFFNSAVLVLLILIDNEYQLVFQKRSKHIRQPGEICFPGGKVDKEDSSLIETVLRETYEELGIPKENINVIGRLKTIIAPFGAIVDPFIGITDYSIKNIIINKDEVEEIIHIPLSFFLENPPKKYSAQIKMQPYLIDEKTGEKLVLLPGKELGLPDMYHDSWGNYHYNIYLYKYMDHNIWGMTARVIMDFIEGINSSHL